ncbi:hypothetical protein AOQ84DRAFT_387383 [Glonium stellatum]|uniref:Uncharacterized protein n=1 Tax=Glonium stellatum TaxID=574774 RepID=A0A8E2F4W6_9PEZI|nr:hypothetical protein AOQ84DRAFT_387383 [Glonium stellatum]
MTAFYNLPSQLCSYAAHAFWALINHLSLLNMSNKSSPPVSGLFDAPTFSFCFTDGTIITSSFSPVTPPTYQDGKRDKVAFNVFHLILCLILTTLLVKLIPVIKSGLLAGFSALTHGLRAARRTHGQRRQIRKLAQKITALEAENGAGAVKIASLSKQLAESRLTIANLAEDRTSLVVLIAIKFGQFQSILSSLLTTPQPVEASECVRREMDEEERHEMIRREQVQADALVWLEGDNKIALWKLAKLIRQKRGGALMKARKGLKKAKEAVEADTLALATQMGVDPRALETERGAASGGAFSFVQDCPEEDGDRFLQKCKPVAQGGDGQDEPEEF